MKFFILLATYLVVATQTFAADPEIKSIDKILHKATTSDTKDLGKLLKQIRLVPAPDLVQGQRVMKVVFVEKDSVFEREGIKVGDLVATKQGAPRGSTKLINSKQLDEKPQ